MTSKIFSLSLAFMMALFMVGCSEDSTGACRSLGQDSCAGEDSALFSSENRFSCQAVPSKMPVAAGEEILVTLTPSGGQAPYYYNGTYQMNGADTLARKFYSNQPAVFMFQDSRGNQATCGFSVVIE